MNGDGPWGSSATASRVGTIHDRCRRLGRLQPSVLGLEKYHGEPSGEAYNLLFEQVARDLATREFVVANPRSGSPRDLAPDTVLHLARGTCAWHLARRTSHLAR